MALPSSLSEGAICQSRDGVGWAWRHRSAPVAELRSALRHGMVAGGWRGGDPSQCWELAIWGSGCAAAASEPSRSRLVSCAGPADGHSTGAASAAGRRQVASHRHVRRRIWPRWNRPPVRSGFVVPCKKSCTTAPNKIGRSVLQTTLQEDVREVSPTLTLKRTFEHASTVPSSSRLLVCAEIQISYRRMNQKEEEEEGLIRK